MSRYIEADDFFRTFEELDIEPYNNFPTADVVPSRYGCGSAPYCSYVFEVDEDE